MGDWDHSNNEGKRIPVLVNTNEGCKKCCYGKKKLKPLTKEVGNGRCKCILVTCGLFLSCFWLADSYNCLDTRAEEKAAQYAEFIQIQELKKKDVSTYNAAIMQILVYKDWMKYELVRSEKAILNRNRDEVVTLALVSTNEQPLILASFYHRRKLDVWLKEYVPSKDENGMPSLVRKLTTHDLGLIGAQGMLEAGEMIKWLEHKMKKEEFVSL